MIEAGISNTDLADRTDVSIQAVGFWLKTGKISKHRMARISAAVNRSVDWILTGHDSPNNYDLREGRGYYAPDQQSAEFLDALSKITPEERDALLALMRSMSGRQRQRSARVVGEYVKKI